MTTHGELTRNESYESEQPVAGGKRQVVLSFVKVRGTHGATREEIADGTGLRLSCVCGRVRELLDTEELAESGTRRIGVSGKACSVVIARGVQHAERIESVGTSERQRCEQPNSQTNRGSIAGDSRQPRSGASAGTAKEVRSVGLHGTPHPIAAKLAALAAERVDAAVAYVTGERRAVETWRVGVEIMRLRRCGVLAWPEADPEQWLAAVEAAVAQGKLELKNSKVQLATASKQKVVQQELF